MSSQHIRRIDPRYTSSAEEALNYCDPGIIAVPSAREERDDDVAVRYHRS